MKTCFKCKKQKDFCDFYKHKGLSDGLLGKCKTCTKSDVSKHRESNIEKIRNYDKNRPRRKINPEVARAMADRWRFKNPEKHKAQCILRNAVARGKIIKMECLMCDNYPSQGHHEDYNYPLDVVWLCAKCHTERHREIKYNKTTLKYEAL